MRSVLILIGLLILSCDSERQRETIVSGIIQNPTHNHIYLYQSKNVYDTITLNSDGSFHSQIDIKKPQLMVFRHPPEYQTFFMEPGDSLSFRLNTLDFDNSLMFSGDLSAENNFLMDMYLMNEADNKLILSYYKIKPEDFINKTDSIKQLRIQKLNKLTKEHDFTYDFIELAKNTINYEFYDMRERYAFLLKKYFPKKSARLTDTYFDYRNSVSFNNEQMINHIGYLRFLDDYIKNIAVDNCIKAKDAEKIDCYNLNSFHSVHNRLKIADSIFKHKSLKNKFLGRFFAQEFVYASTNKQLDSALKALNKVDIEKYRHQELKKFAEFHKHFVEGHQVNQMKLKNHNKDTVQLNQFMNKPFTALHVWSTSTTESNRHRFALIKRLRKDYPQINFIGINIDGNQYNQWQRSIKNHNLNRNHELQALNTDNTKYYNYYLNRFTLINQDGKIVDANILKSDSHVKHFIEQNINKKPE
jgi:hypothetical protein